MLMVDHLIAHKDSENKWIAKVLEINGNDLRVSLISDHGIGSWKETWDLAETQAKLSSGEYYLVGKVNGEHSNS